jgi:hypothetical protein
MRLFPRGCASRQAAYLAVADRLGARERAVLEAHAASCGECADALRNARPVDIALRGAFAPLRERRTTVAPGRVRLAIAPRDPRPDLWLRAPRFFSRLTEVSVMLSVTLLAVGSLEPPTRQSPSAPATHSLVQEYFRPEPPISDADYIVWLRLVKPDDSDIYSGIFRGSRPSPR